VHFNPSFLAAGFVAREYGLAEGVFDTLKININRVANLSVVGFIDSDM